MFKIRYNNLQSLIGKGKMKIKILFYSIFLFSGLCSLFAGDNLKDKAVLNINGRPLYVEIAKTPEERQKGLMFRKYLENNHGMLFVFSEERILSFWMKNTYIPLTIAFIDERGIVVDIFDMEPFSTEPVVSTLKCKYALEVNRGFFDRCGLKVGDKIDLSGIYR